MTLSRVPPPLSLSLLCVCLADCSSRCTCAHIFVRKHDSVRPHFLQGPLCFSFLLRIDLHKHHSHTPCLVRASYFTLCRWPPLPLFYAMLCQAPQGTAASLENDAQVDAVSKAEWRPGRRAGPPPLLTAHAHTQPAHPPPPFSLCLKMAQGMQELPLEEEARMRVRVRSLFGETKLLVIQQHYSSPFTWRFTEAQTRPNSWWFCRPARTRRLLVRQHAHAVPPPKQ